MKEEKKRPVRKANKVRAKPEVAKEQHKFGQFRLPENVHLKGVVDWKP
jgi:hypothetical protein